MNVFNESCRATGSAVCDNFWPRYYDGLTERDFEYSRDVTTTDAALYGELTYHFTEKFRLPAASAGSMWSPRTTPSWAFPVVGWTSDKVPSSDGSDDDILGKVNASCDPQ